ncbi:MAG: hypothetical protein BAJALOKI2v1_190030 [Promethearchaeota archaeon]|nr:MAG: hypothetical protein BAJALOKI2v1_190030 [Candidatus Lokiarchaeota archaeon]
MALVECIDEYGRKLKKLGKISRISACFWPVRLIPLNETRACVCSYLLNKQEKLDVGKFSQVPPKPDNVIKGADPESFLESLETYNHDYLRKTKYFRRSSLVQEALFSANEINYFKNFFLNMYDIKAFSDPYFLLEGEPISKSVDQIKIIPEIYDFVALKDVKMLENYADLITDLCDKWLNRSTKEVDKLRSSTVDVKKEEKQLERLNKELQEEKEKDLQASPEALIKTGKYKINDKTSEFFNNINDLKSAVEGLREAINKRDLFLLDKAMKDVDLRYQNLGNSISRYKTEISQLKKNLQKEKSDIERIHQKKIADLESRISQVKKDIDAKHSELGDDLSSVEDIIVEIKEMKQECLNNIEEIKDQELSNVQEFLNNYTIEIKTNNVVVGIPIFVFYFADPKTNKITERAPVLPILVKKGKIVSGKIKDKFRDKLRDLMNKYTPMINLVEMEGQEANLMTVIKNLDTRLEEAVNDLRIKKILSKKEASNARDVIGNLIW